MTSFSVVPQQSGRGWGVLALITAAVPLPFLFALNILSLVVRNQIVPGGENWVYGLIAGVGLILFPLFLILTITFGVLAVVRPRRSGRVMGIIALAVATLSIPLLWLGYLVWIR